MQGMQEFYPRQTSRTAKNLSNKGNPGSMDVRSNDGLAHQPDTKTVGWRQRRLVAATTLVLAGKSAIFADADTTCQRTGFSPTPAADIAQTDKTPSQTICNSGSNRCDHIVYRSIQS